MHGVRLAVKDLMRLAVQFPKMRLPFGLGFRVLAWFKSTPNLVQIMCASCHMVMQNYCTH